MVTLILFYNIVIYGILSYFFFLFWIRHWYNVFGLLGPNVNVGPRSTGTITPPLPPSHVQWYYPPTPASPYIHRQYHQTAVPYYGYAPATYVATTNGSYNHVSGFSSATFIPINAHYMFLFILSINRYKLCFW